MRHGIQVGPSGNSQTDAATDLRTVPAKLQSLDASIAGLKEELDYLVKDIDPILGPNPPSAVSEANKIGHGCSSVASKLQSMIEMVQMLTAGVAHIRSRVEV